MNFLYHNLLCNHNSLCHDTRCSVNSFVLCIGFRGPVRTCVALNRKRRFCSVPSPTLIVSVSCMVEMVYRERSELTSWRARVSVHAIRKCSIYVDSCRSQFNGTVEGLHHTTGS